MSILEASLNTTRKIGIEIEAVIADTAGASRMAVQERLAQIFSANGLPAVARPYSHSPLPHGTVLAVEYDGSLVGDSRGYQAISFHQLEVKTHPLNGFGEFMAVVPKAMQLLQFLGGKVDRSCGCHVTLDAASEVRSNTFVRSLLNLTYRFEPVIFGLVPKSRSTCGYARPMPDLRSDWSRCRSMRCYRRVIDQWNRYVGLNITHLSSDNPRVEFRWHNGTLNHGRLTHWVTFLNRLMDAAATRNCQTPREQVRNSHEGLNKMLVTLGLRTNTRVWKVSRDLAPTRRYLIQRWKQLNAEQLPKRTRSVPRASVGIEEVD